MKAEAQSGSSSQGSTDVRVVDPVDRYLALGIRGGIIGIGILGLGIYVKNSRFFARFQHVSRIPKEFLQKELELKGIVREVSPRGMLKVEHQPIVSLPPFLARKTPKNVSLLNLRLAALNVSDAGLSYLAKDMRLENRPVTFTVLKISEKNPDAADADVFVKRSLLNRINLNVDLVRRGLARIQTTADPVHLKDLQFNSAYARLVTRLLMCEKVAERRGVGIWERSSVAESLRALPSTLGQIIRTSTVAKLSVLTFEMLRDLVFVCVELLKQAYYLALVLGGYTKSGYRSLGNGVDRFSRFYAAQKKRIIDFRAGTMTQPGKKEIRKAEE